MANCPHDNQTTTGTQQGTETVTVTKCDDCGAVLSSSRRTAYGKKKR